MAKTMQKLKYNPVFGGVLYSMFILIKPQVPTIQPLLNAGKNWQIFLRAEILQSRWANQIPCSQCLNFPGTQEVSWENQSSLEYLKFPGKLEASWETQKRISLKFMGKFEFLGILEVFWETCSFPEIRSFFVETCSLQVYKSFLSLVFKA